MSGPTAADGLDDVIAAHCPRAPPAEWLATCRSTNETALGRLAEGAPHGTLIAAAEQTAGRGRLGRGWHSPAGLGLYASLVVRAPEPIAAPTLLVAAAGLGLAEGLESVAAVAARIKWPNDVWIADRKLAGILVETRGFEPARPAFVVGFGVNVNHGAGDFPRELADAATSLRIETGRPHDVRTVLRDIAGLLLPRIGQALAPRGDGDAAVTLDADYRGRSLLRGRRVSLTVGPDRISGMVESVSPVDGIALRGDDGGLHRVRAEHASEVRLEPTP